MGRLVFAVLIALSFVVSGPTWAATYAELAGIQQETDYPALVAKIKVAVAVKAVAVANEATPTAEMVAWSVEALRNPQGMALRIVAYVIAANANYAITQILGASDTAVQTNVDTAVEKLFGV